MLGRKGYANSVNPDATTYLTQKGNLGVGQINTKFQNHNHHFWTVLIDI